MIKNYWKLYHLGTSYCYGFLAVLWRIHHQPFCCGFGSAWIVSKFLGPSTGWLSLYEVKSTLYPVQSRMFVFDKSNHFTQYYGTKNTSKKNILMQPKSKKEKATIMNSQSWIFTGLMILLPGNHFSFKNKVIFTRDFS